MSKIFSLDSSDPDYIRFTTDNTLNRYDILGQNLNSNYQLGDLNLGFFATLNNSRSKAHQMGADDFQCRRMSIEFLFRVESR